jgi:hypothetical protein
MHLHLLYHLGTVPRYVLARDYLRFKCYFSKQQNFEWRKKISKFSVTYVNCKAWIRICIDKNVGSGSAERIESRPEIRKQWLRRPLYCLHLLFNFGDLESRF